MNRGVHVLLDREQSLTSNPAVTRPPVLIRVRWAGSGSRRGRGPVTLDGKPLLEGSILFTPLAAPWRRGRRESEGGRYHLPAGIGPAIGRNRVEIRALRKTGKMVPKAFGQPGEMVPEKVEAVPPRFNHQSKLIVEIKPGNNTADIAVSSR